MSSPHTNIEKQKRRHYVPLVGMAIVGGGAFVLFLIWLLYTVSGDDAGPVEQTAPAAVESQ